MKQLMEKVPLVQVQDMHRRHLQQLPANHHPAVVAVARRIVSCSLEPLLLELRMKALVQRNGHPITC